MIPVTDVRPGTLLESRCGVAEVLAADCSEGYVVVTFSCGEGVTSFELPDCALVTLAGESLSANLPIRHPETRGMVRSALSVVSRGLQWLVLGASRIAWGTE